ncbi:MAG: hypothetical protein U0414_25715 [Polyangiaceae bacterium]
MRFRRGLTAFAVLVPAFGGLAVAMLPTSGCDDAVVTPPTDSGPQVRPGDICDEPLPNELKLRATPERVFVKACTGDACPTREAKIILEPDVCNDRALTITSSDPALEAPTAEGFGLYKGASTITIKGAATPGTYTLTAAVKDTNAEATASIEVVVLPSDAPTCTGTASIPSLTAGSNLTGEGGLAGASIGLPPHANDPNSGSYLWSVAPFPATIGCGSMELPAGFTALGPAITFGDETLKFQREIPLSVPVNPALLPDKARMRHVRVLYSGPAFKKPRIIPAADVRFEKVNGAWAMTFKAPRLGTYQAIVATDAGAVSHKRRLTHRAVTGVSMGGIGSSMFGMRHHDKFDVVAPLGGPGAWTWLLDHLDRNHLGGFRPIAPGTQQADIQLTKTPCTTDAECKPDERCVNNVPPVTGGCTLLPKPVDPYEHTQTFNTWWAEYPRTGTGGSFPRDEYAQIFRDLSLQFGNPNSDNLTKGAEFLPAGVSPTDKSVVGDHPGDQCATWVDPIDGPNKEQQDERAHNCPHERCAHTLKLDKYYDRNFNPDGAFPVITVCDGSSTNESLTPYANSWHPDGNDYPLEVGLAVDYNNNGVRDELEPIVKSAHEPWTDTGPDQLLSVDEPGYDAKTNPDPNGDDFDAQYNPGGTEGDHIYQEGEPFEDVGLDGVAGPPQQPAYPMGWQKAGDGYDVGEADGKFTTTRGLQRMWDRDPTNVLLQKSKDVPGGPLDDAALQRVDLWTDGGLRDIFNFHVAAAHMIGGMVPRGRAVNYYTHFWEMPGFDAADPNSFNPARVDFADVPGGVLMRYGAIDPTADDIDKGSGQHVGSVSEIAYRLQTALYYIGARWPEPELRSFVASSASDPDPDAAECEIEGTCTIQFQSSSGRTGPVTINFPPGYAHKAQKDRKYPVIYMLHGYGQTPEDLGAAIVFVTNWMNNSNDSVATRLPKALLVYVDGRCREGANGKAECIRGGFYTDSPREGGFENESWWLELMDYVDAHYRTMPATEVDWTE